MTKCRIGMKQNINGKKHILISNNDTVVPFMPRQTNSFEHLLPPSWKRQVADWLAEDTPSFDYAGYVVGEVEREAFLLGKGHQLAVLAGSPFVTEIFAQLGCELRIPPFHIEFNLTGGVLILRVKWHVMEGETFEPVMHIATVRGKARFLLLGERLALNLLARCSGIATKYYHHSLFERLQA